jgi:PAS domain-containing protein
MSGISSRIDALALDDIAAAAHRSFDVPEVLGSALRTALEALSRGAAAPPIEGGAICLCGGHGRGWQLAAALGLEPAVSASLAEIPGLFSLDQPAGGGEDSAGAAADGARPLIVPDLEGQMPALAAAVSHGWRALASLPLPDGGRKTAGWMTLLSCTPHCSTTGDTVLLSRVGRSVGHAIESARQFQEIQRLRGFNENVVQGVAEAIWIEDGGGRIQFANPALEALLGYGTSELIGRH